MNKYAIALSLFVIYCAAVNNPNNPDLEVTGAPGELTCQRSGCHNGGNFVGMVKLEGIPDTIVPNTNYNITLRHTSNAVRAGFEITGIDLDGKRAGTFVRGTGTSVGVGRTFSRHYIRQSSPKLLNNGETSWDFQWTSPASLTTGDSVYFYFVSLAANGTGNQNGDNVLRDSKAYYFQSNPSSTSSEKKSFEIKIFPTVVEDYLIIEKMPWQTAELTIIDGYGREVFKKSNVSKETSINPGCISSGAYYLVLHSGKEKQVIKIIKK